jgi:hypothetical protein
MAALPSFLESVKLPRRRGLFAVPDNTTLNPTLPTPQPIQPLYDELPPATSVPALSEPSVNAGTPPVVSSDQRGRPKPLPKVAGEDNLDRAQQYETAVEDYEPQKAKGWKRWLVPIALNALAGAGRGTGLPGLLGGAIVGATQGAVNPAAYDKLWKENELKSAQQRTGALQKQADEAQKRRLQAAQIKDYESEIDARKNAPSKPAPTSYRVLTRDEYGLPAGTKIQRVFKNGTFVDDVDAQGNPIALDLNDAKTKPARTWEIAGQLVQEQPDGSIKPIYTSPEKAGEGKPDYATRAAWNYKKQTEQEAYAKDLEQQAAQINPQVDIGGGQLGIDPSKQAQKESLLKQAQDAKEAARKYRDAGDEASTQPQRISPTGGPKWSASKWQKANPQGDLNAARNAARSAGYTVVE